MSRNPWVSKHFVTRCACASIGACILLTLQLESRLQPRRCANLKISTCIPYEGESVGLAVAVAV